ncbi:MAG: polymer-forming cytoskeletal protein [Nitrospirota bacterium]|nr:polymer-forming cytoskeletal protein [Nitrospirota bacterium]
MFGRNSESDTHNSGTSSHSSTGSPRGHTEHDNVFDQNHDVSAFVGEGVEFKGVISYEGTVRIDGHLEGEIYTQGTLIIGQGAVINAKVEAGTIVCQGHIVGDIIAKEKIQLLAPAVMDGSVKTPSLSMEEGVLFNGTCKMGSAESGESRGFKSQEGVGAYDESLKAV